jgi:hypothetical protein
MNTIRIPHGSSFIEIQANDMSEIAEILRQIRASERVVERKASNSVAIPETQDKPKRKSLTAKTFDSSEYEPISKSETEARGGRGKNSLYQVFLHKPTGELVGRITSYDSNNQIVQERISLGSPNNPESSVFQMISAIKTVPVERPFTRSTLGKIQPRLTQRGDLMKLILDYLQEVGFIEKLKERDFSSGALMYKRLTENVGSGSSKKMVSSPLEPSL